MRIIKPFIVMIVTLIFFIITPITQSSVFGETGDEFFPDFESDKDMKMLKSVTKPLVISYGGWINSVLIDERDEIDDDRRGSSGREELLSSITIAKIWLKSYLWKNNFVYVRAKNVYMDVLKEEGIDIDDRDNMIDLDVGFIALTTENNMLKLYMGRKFFILGTGLVFNGRGDGGELDFYSRYLDIKLFSTYTGLIKKDNNPYFLSDKDFSEGSRRIFTGGMFSKMIFNQTVYLIGLSQIDKGKEETGEKTRYNSEYYGIGFKGVFEDAFYFGEFIYEKGHSYFLSTVTSLYERSDISALAAIFGLNYYVDPSYIPYNTVLLLRYFYGSGDGDRDNYKLSTGNASGEDNGFIYFGSFVGGYALKPLLANLHIIRGGFSVSPFYNLKSRFLNRMNLCTKYSYYLKDRAGSGINYGEAVDNSRDIGHGVDVICRWRIFYDLSVYVNYALFIPGKAYSSSEDNRNFFMGGFHLTI